MKPIGFPVSAKKFWVMSVCTCYFYNIYWAYQNFRHLNIQINTKVWAAVYALFLPISFIVLMKGLQSTAAESGAKVELKLAALAVSFFFLILIVKALAYARVPIGELIVLILAVAPLYQVQMKINAVNAELRPDMKPDEKFSVWDIAGMVIFGGLYLVGTLSGPLPHQ